MARMVDISGNKYGNLTVIERIPRSEGDKHTKWKCFCVCGAQTISTYINLKTGNTTSCGCKRKPHGGTGSLTFSSWHSMMRRCVWKSDAYRYQGIVSVCDRWKDYKLFIEDLGERPSRLHSLDRIDNSKGYEPGNVRWATATEQAQNKTNNRWIVINGEKKIISEWARYFGVTASALRIYIARHGSIDGYVDLWHKRQQSKRNNKLIEVECEQG